MRLWEELADRGITFLFAVVFVTAAQGQALGLRHCSLHDALPGTGAPSSHGEYSSTDDGSQRPSSSDHRTARGHHHAAQEGEHSGAPGGCMDDCHVGATTVASRVAAVSEPALHPSSGPIGGPEGPTGPRHNTYELHLPNAPPLFV